MKDLKNLFALHELWIKIMAFKKTPPPLGVPDSPEKILLDLPRRKIPGALIHQGETMRAYAANAVNVPDVALQLPTGSGKTLVGLMIGEWRRRKFHERVVYLCPNRQLVNQVVEQANDQYGLSVNGFTGKVVNYAPISKAEYQNADRIAITTYNALFNTNPFFDNAETIIIDDAHAAENYIGSVWSVRIELHNLEHKALHAAVSSALKPLINISDYARLTGNLESISDAAWVDKLPTPELLNIKDQLIGIIDTHAGELKIRYPWSMIRDHLHACQLYMTSQDILIRPIIPPTWSHDAFVNAKQRIFMSATLGAGGDLERLTGRKNILRLPVPEGWDRQGIGRRYFIFPDMSLTPKETITLRKELIIKAGRSLILVTSDPERDKISAELSALHYPIFKAEDIESSKKAFTETEQAIAIVANRYDGIDFPGEDCRLLFINGLPKATNAQEKFFMSRMGANVLFNERIQTRILQAIGRCTRSLQDFSAVVISGEDLPDYLIDRKRRRYFHPELQAEIDFGIEQSSYTTLHNLIDNFRVFIENGSEWEQANDLILAKREAARQEKFPAIDILEACVNFEIEFQERLWQGDYEASLSAAEKVLALLIASELRGYRALWHYLAGCAAWMGGKQGVTALTAKARLQFKQAKEAARGIPWLVSLARYQSEPTGLDKYNDILFGQLERLESILAKQGQIHTRQYDKKEKFILEGLATKDNFEEAQRQLGELLGFEAGNQESDASPDPWWIAGNICIVFEDHAGAETTSSLDATKARQTAGHPNWINENVQQAKDCSCISVLVSPVSTARTGAIPHLKDFKFWSLDEFREWAKNALTVVRELRSTFIEPGDLDWRSQASEAFEKNGMDAISLFNTLNQRSADIHLKEEHFPR